MDGDLRMSVRILAVMFFPVGNLFLPSLLELISLRIPWEYGVPWRRITSSVSREAACNCLLIRSYTKARVQVHEHLDGHLSVHYASRCVATTEAREGRERQTAPLPLGL
jgi:hypothetical protein